MSKVKSKRSTESDGVGTRRRFRPAHYDLDVWRESMRLAVDVYQVTNEFPPSDRYGLAAHIRRSAISIPSNLAEGAARGSAREFVRFLLIARGSLLELDTQLWLARELRYPFDHEPLKDRISSLCITLNALINSSRKRTAKPQ